MKRKGAGILAGIVVALMVALAVTPTLVDWTRYKDDLAARLETAVGRKVAIDGAVSFTFVPTPAFIAKDVHLSDTPGVAVAVSRLEVRLRLLPLLTGRLEIATLILGGADIQLDHRAPAGAGSQGEKPAASGVVAASVDNVIIDQGRLSYLSATGASWRFDKLTASFAAQTGGGGRLVGSARFNTLDFTFEALQGSALSGQATPVNLSLTTAEGGGTLRFGGQLTDDGGERRVKGKLSVKASDPGRIGAAFGDAAAALSLPLGNVGLSATVDASAHDILFDALDLTLGGVEGTGNAGIALTNEPQVDLKLGFNRLDLDALAAGLRGGMPGKGIDAGGLPAVPTTVGGLFLPTGISASLDVSAAVTVLRGGLLKGAHVNAALANGELMLNQASLSLPGNTAVNLFGFLVTPKGVPDFDGSFEAVSDDLRAFCDWLKIDVSAVPADRLQAVRLAGKVKARPDQIAIDSTQIRLDGARIDTAATLHLGEKPTLGVSFAVDTLNVDAYWPQARPAEPAPGGPAPAATSAADGAAIVLPLAWLGDLEANVNGRVGQLVAHGLTAQNVSIDGFWGQGQLALRDFSIGDVAGAQLHLDGAVGGSLAAGPSFHGVHYVLRSAQPERLVRQLGIPLPFEPERLGSVSLSGTLDGGLDALSVDSRSELAGAVVSLSGRLETPMSAGRFDGQLDLSAPDALRLIRLGAPDYRPAAGLGALSLTGHLDMRPTSLHLSDLQFKVGALAADGVFDLDWTGKPRIDATLGAGEIVPAPFLPARTPAARPTAERPREEPRHGLPVTATDRVSAAPRAQVVASAIPERWSHDLKDFSWLNRLDGSLALSGKALLLGQSRIVDPSLSLELADGTLTLKALAGRLFGGALSGNGHLAGDGGVALALNLAHAQTRDAMLGVADVDVADGLLDAAVDLSSAGLSDAEWIGRLAGTGRIAMTDGTVRGFDLKAVDDRLRGLDTPAGLLALLQSGLTGGKTHFSRLTGDFHVAGGLVTTDDLALDADGGGATAKAEINLPAAVMDARAEFHLAGAPAAPPLVMRLNGPFDNPRRFVDINDIQQWLAGFAKAKRQEILKGMLKGLGR